jgi:hypothetical protein
LPQKLVGREAQHRKAVARPDLVAFLLVVVVKRHAGDFEHVEVPVDGPLGKLQLGGKPGHIPRTSLEKAFQNAQDICQPNGLLRPPVLLGKLGNIELCLATRHFLRHGSHSAGCRQSWRENMSDRDYLIPGDCQTWDSPILARSGEKQNRPFAG